MTNLTAIIEQIRHMLSPSKPPHVEPPPIPPPPATPDLLVPPPMVDGDTLRDWMVHHHRRNADVWAGVVSEFYTRAAADPEVAAYFQGVDLDVLQRHFMRALLVVTHIGLTTRAADALGQRHAHLHITKDVFDKTVDVLVNVLTDYGTPRGAVVQLLPIVGILRRRIVAA